MQQCLERAAVVFLGGMPCRVSIEGTTEDARLHVQGWPAEILIFGSRQSLHDFGADILRIVATLPEPATAEQAAIYPRLDSID